MFTIQPDGTNAMYQPNLQHVLAKSTMPRTVQDYNAALASAGGFLQEIERAHANPLPGDPLGKSSTFSESTSATSGLTYYDLELGAKFLYPLLTPLRNEVPRVSGKGGIQANWRAVTGVNTTGLRIGVSGGNRGGVQAVSTQDYTAAYKGIGIETSVDFEAQYAGMGFDDVRAIGAKVGLEACMLGEELLILGGNTSVALSTTPTPSLAPSTTGGSLTAAASPYSVICVALSLDAVVNGSVCGGIQGAITRSNADGSSDTFGGGAAAKSANATASISSGTTGSIAATVAPVTGALGYAWFWGAAGSEVLGAITTINSLVITATAAGTQTAASLGSSDNSTNALVFDGLLYQAFKSGSNAYVAYLATGTAGSGSTLTGDGAGGIVEIDAALKNRWDTYRLSPDTMWVSSQVANNLSAKDPRRRQQCRAALCVRERAGRARRRYYGPHLPQQVLHGRPEDARHPCTPEHARGHDPDDLADAAVSAVERRQRHADPHPPGLLSDRVAAARPPLRDRRLRRRGAAALLPAVHGGDLEYRRGVKRRLSLPPAILKVVMRGLDPRIHAALPLHGLPDQVRQ